MNSYRELVAKLEAISGTVKESTQSVEECGMPGMAGMPSGMAGMREQPDQVTMNVSMNGSGAGGIRDLMSILRDIENGSDEPAHEPHGTDMIVGMDDAEMEEEIDGGFQSATTEPSEETAGVDAVTPTGNDLASKGDEAPKVNGGGNPFVKEGLLDQLNSLYQEVKLR